MTPETENSLTLNRTEAEEIKDRVSRCHLTKILNAAQAQVQKIAATQEQKIEISVSDKMDFLSDKVS